MSSGGDDEIEFGYSVADGEEFTTTTSTSYHYLVEFCNEEESETADPEAPTEPKIPLDDKRIETIKSIMSGISLAPTAVPAWAESVPDRELNHFVEKKTAATTEENWAVFEK